MKSSIQVSEVNTNNKFKNEIKIVGAESEAEAKDAAEEWCDENNCLLQEINQDSVQSNSNYSSQIVFSAKVSSDDYK